MKLSKEFIAMFREEARRARWEINSWNGKGIDDLVVDYLERKELKPEDFTGAVILTLEEAKEIFWLLVGCWWEEDCEEKELRLNDKWRELLPNRIEQAEVAKIGDDYNKALNKVIEEFQKQAESKDE